MKHYRSRATAVVIRKGGVLLVRDRGKRHFSLPGGGVHKGEPPLSAAARELYEETGLNASRVVRVFNYRGSVNEHRVFLVEADGDVHLKGRELSEFIWWDRKTAVPIYPHVAAILDGVADILGGT